jgi:tRNA U34 5-methylaminomethyl-2-thiouridine-forming methyltransferase MnmC
VAAHLVPIQTGDGSYTFYNTLENTYFRSLQGARGEAQYVFVDGTRLPELRGDWRVLELGLGPGMNFLVTAQAFLEQKSQARLSYHVLEQEPLSAGLISQLAYSQWLKYPAVLTLLQNALEQAPAGKTVSLEWQSVELVLYPRPWAEANLASDLLFDAIYHDPFGPTANPNCWNQACFEWEAAHLAQKGLITTYGASTPMRQAMTRAGLFLASRKGSGNKREMTLAAHQLDVLAGYSLLSREKYLK